MEFNFKKSYLIIAGAIFLILLFFGSSMFVTLQPGERGVIFRKFTSGLDKEKIFMPGFHIIAPWNDLIKYNVREQRSEENMDVLETNGLTLQVDAFIRYNPIPDKIGYIHEEQGKEYINKVVVPAVRAAVRRVMGQYSAEEIYSTKRAEVETAISEQTSKSLLDNNIMIQEFLIRSIKLPEQLKKSIEMKLQQEQEALAYQFRLDREKSEAERKRIEAQGIADFNKIVNASLSSNILKQKGIDATLELSKSSNAKVVVVGSGKDGLPLILGNN